MPLVVAVDIPMRDRVQLKGLGHQLRLQKLLLLRRTKASFDVDRDQARPTDGHENDGYGDDHVEENVNCIYEDFTQQVLVAAPVVDADERVHGVLHETQEQHAEAEVDEPLPSAETLTLGRPFDFDPAIERDESKDPRVAEIDLVIDAEQKEKRRA